MTPAHVGVVLAMMRPLHDLDLARLTDDPAALDAIREHVAGFVEPDFEVQVAFAAPAGRRREMPVGAIYEVRDGRIARARFFPDEASARAEIA